MQTREDAYDHLLLRPFSPGYTIWVRHGENPVEESPRLGRVDDNMISQVNQMHQMVNEAFNFTIQHESEDITQSNMQKMMKTCYRALKLYHIKCMCGVSDKAMTMILDLLRDAFEQAKLPNTVCKKCGCSRWKQKTKKGSILRLNVPVKRNGKPIAAKTLRYFPLIPRLQRLFMCSKTSSDMLWHSQASNNDGFLRHPRDAEAWKKFDAKYTNFSADPRNVRLALARDGFNPFGNMSTKYSIWPVILIPYNLPPWLCMKQTSFILSTLIPGPKMQGNDIDIYLQPLIDELKQLWDGVETYDAKEGNTFKMCAALMWTISDFPGLGNLSGWNTHSGLTCPTCNLDAKPHRLKDSQKWYFMGHRRFLNQGHKYILDQNRFEGQVEGRDPPKKLSRTDVLSQQSNVHVSFGKSSSVTSKKRCNGQDVDEDDLHCKKKSVFFDLPYWEDQMLRHNLDVMHIEKNVCDNVVFTILNDSGKSKDNVKARRDLQCMGIRPELWPGEGGKYPSAIFAMLNSQRDVFLKTLQNVFFPDGYSSNVARCVDLRNMEMIFPPSFFTVMVHLTVHLVDEVTLGGPVHYRWMYPIERYLGHLKQYVRNRAQPEGSIAEGYLSEQILTFCSRYLDNIETRINRPGQVDD
ncbi:uncharacterized protein LOC107647394 [Arachis ipaensis]|uniref:uncharacterized protein LOC107647394 n=1 Tax=Arachis ipaensis TaxID=130454 RepID=UPI0007AFC9CF|nr:uncharacterized protein LOC107647394 [Arachis ipaensis]XP_025661935.1 uncharacterized protein LOC112757594 [Arachis hypogaea]